MRRPARPDGDIVGGSAGDPKDLFDLQRAARGGLCGACRHARLVRNPRGSVFARCVHPDLPKYPRQPVLQCDGFGPPVEEPAEEPPPAGR